MMVPQCLEAERRWCSEAMANRGSCVGRADLWRVGLRLSLEWQEHKEGKSRPLDVMTVFGMKGGSASETVG